MFFIQEKQAVVDNKISASISIYQYQYKLVLFTNNTCTLERESHWTSGTGTGRHEERCYPETQFLYVKT